MRDEPSYTEIWNKMSTPSASDYKLMVMRVAPHTFRGYKINGYLETFHLPTTIPDIIEQIGSKYGGGQFQIRIVDGAGKYVKSKTFEIAGIPILPESAPVPNDELYRERDQASEEIKRLKTQLSHKNSLLEIKDQLILGKDKALMEHKKNKGNSKKGRDMKDFLENSHDDIDDINLHYDSRGQLMSRDEDEEALADWSNFAIRLHTTETLATAKKDVEIARTQERISMYRYELYATVARWIAAAATFSSMTYFITP